MSPLAARPAAPAWWYEARRELSVELRVKILAELKAKGRDIRGWPT